MIRVAINGFGRIGRCLLRAWAEANLQSDFEVVAINELADPSTIAYLTKHDSTHGRFPREVRLEQNQLLIGEQTVEVLNEPNVDRMPWRDLNVDLVFECTGSFSDRATAELHLSSGAKKVLFSQPANRDVDATIVYGVNDHVLEDRMTIVSAASCTTNAVVPVIDCLDKAIGIESGMIRTIHAAMHDQPVIDAYHSQDLRKTRAAFESLIPVKTALAVGIERILPALKGKFAATAIRVPVSNVSSMDVTVNLSKNTSTEQINRLLADAAANGYGGVLGYTEEPLVSCDFVHDHCSGIVDAVQTTMAGERMAKLLIWFDNEWGYANRMLDVAKTWCDRH